MLLLLRFPNLLGWRILLILLCVPLGVRHVTPIYIAGYSKIFARVQLSAKKSYQVNSLVLCLEPGCQQWTWVLKLHWYPLTESSHKGLGNSKVSLVSFIDAFFFYFIQAYFESSQSEINPKRCVRSTENQAQLDTGGHGIAEVFITICTSFALPLHTPYTHVLLLLVCSPLPIPPQVTTWKPNESNENAAQFSWQTLLLGFFGWLIFVFFSFFW